MKLNTPKVGGTLLGLLSLAQSTVGYTIGNRTLFPDDDAPFTQGVAKRAKSFELRILPLGASIVFGAGSHDENAGNGYISSLLLRETTGLSDS